eukprot:1655296-Rhodomonas_salina.3
MPGTDARYAATRRSAAQRQSVLAWRLKTVAARDVRDCTALMRTVARREVRLASYLCSYALPTQYPGLTY